MSSTSMDCGEWESSAFVARDTVETIQALRGQENRYTISPSLHEYCSSLSYGRGEQTNDDDDGGDKSENGDANVIAENRRTLVEWCYRVVDHFNIPRSVVAMAMNFVDRFVAKHLREMSMSNNSRDALKLITTSALQLALKIQRGTQVDSPRSRTFSAAIHVLPKLASRGRNYSEEHFVKFEMVLLRHLGFFVNPPLASDYVPDLIRLLPLAGLDLSEAIYKRLETQATFFTELAVVEYELISAPYSTIALASLLNALRSLSSPTKMTMEDNGFLQPGEANVLSSMLLFLALGEDSNLFNAAAANVTKVQDILWSCLEVQQQDILDEMMTAKEEEAADESSRRSPSCVVDFK